jgi:hypothetical protein
MPIFTILWIIWAVFGIGLELLTVFNHEQGDTLSETIWKWVTGQFYKDRSIPVWFAWMNRIILAAFFIWLAPHLILGIWY